MAPALGANETWQQLKSSLLNASKEICGLTKKGRWRKETWWWDETVGAAVEKKRKLWKAWRKGGSKEEYLEAKRSAKRAVYAAKMKAEESKFSNVNKNTQDVFRIAKLMKRKKQDTIGDCCVRDNQGNVALSDDAKKAAWKEHYERLLNKEFPWSADDLPPADPIPGPPILITP